MILITASYLGLLNYKLIPAMGMKLKKKNSLASWNWSNCMFILQLYSEPGTIVCSLFIFDTVLLFLN